MKGKSVMNVVSKEVKNIDGVIHEEIKVDHPCVGKVIFVAVVVELADTLL